ncbi:type II toxin-antitoxin system HicA family toxin [Candidatus Amarolinea aalborgensis]|jgi:predicted RNA binding protein YcfA (HicA-like mRNA interferase family)|uniref:type II toxin-antitoxin system HicA family toxin n=1 Tax=Candidatus Amarolinea aalborgensis TaxID=2249329 RepID=UPI003BF9C66E
MRYREVARKLHELGCKELAQGGSGSHRKWYNPATGKGTVVPDWGNQDLKTGTLHGVIRQLGLDWEEFKRA